MGRNAAKFSHFGHIEQLLMGIFGCIGHISGCIMGHKWWLEMRQTHFGSVRCFHGMNLYVAKSLLDLDTEKNLTNFRNRIFLSFFKTMTFQSKWSKWTVNRNSIQWNWFDRKKSKASNALEIRYIFDIWIMVNRLEICLQFVELLKKNWIRSKWRHFWNKTWWNWKQKPMESDLVAAQ